MSGDQFGIRLASASDYAALGRVFAEAEEFHRAALPQIFRQPPRLFPPEPLFRQWVSEDGSDVFVADEAGDLIGFVTTREDHAPDEELLQPRSFAVVDLLAVRSDRRRHGAGAALMRAVHGWAAERHLACVSLNVWEFNAAAVHFYQALGYRTASRLMERQIR